MLYSGDLAMSQRILPSGFLDRRYCTGSAIVHQIYTAGWLSWKAPWFMEVLD